MVQKNYLTNFLAISDHFSKEILMTITPKKGEGKDVTIAGQTNEQTRKDSATQPIDHGRLR